MASTLHKRQFAGDETNFDPDDDNYNGWWWSPTGMAVRYAIITLIFVLLIAYFLGGYIHARRRMAKGLPPLAYHRWMAHRRQGRYNAPPQHWNTAQPYYQNQQGNEAYNAGSYGMQGFAPPPPAYDAHTAPPPVYQPPQGGSKVAADQNYGAAPVERVGESSAPVGAPRL